MSMQPRMVEVKPFVVAGIAVRTSNADEGDPASAELPALWSQVSSQGLARKVPNSAPEGALYGVYSDYESDASGPYTVTAGVAVTAAPSEFASAAVEGGSYLAFEGRGPMPETVVRTWKEVWSYFETSKEHRRRFTTDFELHRGPNEVTIHIAVAPAA